ncbi:hypothetical protein C7999DRAFT_32881 [Corynascus novoguineensis]|uniref:Uncharacterized protein n=1 Tax=Corynascus novoguineensis TaxID=1126955 RepID=A0AAN7CRV3_9PEZI|nr:hypothetical protein C7999DRAFT_32881 [Corynascus novoguineensis]
MSVLAHLAAADIMPNTVMVGQQMVSMSILSTRGMQRLTDAPERMHSCSSIGDAIWFGFGIQHIVREMARTAQGVTLIALCGSLAEIHPPNACATILMKLT